MLERPCRRARTRGALPFSSALPGLGADEVGGPRGPRTKERTSNRADARALAGGRVEQQRSITRGHVAPRRRLAISRRAPRPARDVSLREQTRPEQERRAPHPRGRSRFENRRGASKSGALRVPRGTSRFENEEQERVRHASYGRFFVDSLDDILDARRLVGADARISSIERRCARARTQGSIAMRFARCDRKSSTRAQHGVPNTTVVRRKRARAQGRSDDDVRR